MRTARTSTKLPPPRKSEILVARREIEVRINESGPNYRSRVAFAPFGGKVPPPPPQSFVNARHDRPSPNMILFLKARGHSGAANYSRRYAGRLIGYYKAQEVSRKEVG